MSTNNKLPIEDAATPPESTQSTLGEYKKEGFRVLNRGLRDHYGELSMLSTEDRRRASTRP